MASKPARHEFVQLEDGLVRLDTIRFVDTRLFAQTGEIIVHHGLGSGRTKGAQAVEVILWTKPSALEGTHVRWIRHAWAVHNLVGHPLMQILVWLGFRKAAFAVHDGTVPGRDGLVT